MQGAVNTCLGVLDSHSQAVLDYWENSLWMEIVEEKDHIVDAKKGSLRIGALQTWVDQEGWPVYFNIVYAS